MQAENTRVKGNSWLQAMFGIEKENVRVDDQGRIALTPHPEIFGDKKKHPYITTDFSESQVEMITPPRPSIREAIGFLETLHDVVSLELQGEYLWPQSLPPVLPSSDEEIPIAQYRGADQKEERYREILGEKYGRKKQTISGIHFNLSFSDDLFRQLHQEQAPEIPFTEFKNRAYLKVTRQLLRFRWMYVLLYGNTPVLDPSSDLKCRDYPIRFNPDERALSLRNSCFGYGNMVDLFPDYRSVEAYHQSVSEMVNQGKISQSKELYSAVRLKFPESPEQVSYIELRFVDINPLVKAGVSEEMLHFLHALALYGLLSEEADAFLPDAQSLANRNVEQVSMHGLQSHVPYKLSDGSTTNAWDEARGLMDKMKNLFLQLDIREPGYIDALKGAEEKIQHPQTRSVCTLLKAMEKQGYVGFHLAKARAYLTDSQSKSYQFYGLEDMELSTRLLLREAVRRGVRFEILDRKDNFVRLEREGRVQYVKQATMTSLDNYASVLAMENKVVTKKILSEHGLRVPEGSNYDQIVPAQADFWKFQDKATVVKPKLTNFGIGISILKKNDDPTVYQRALEIAFSHDSSVLVEEFVEGKEYRFFVIGDEVVGILHRVPANVSGDAKHTIRELVLEKNKNPLRGKGYRTPLEYISLGEIESMFLAGQGKTFDYVPLEGETVYLRENSNISTGGDSIDFTDEIPESYKQLAVRAAQALDVKIAGVDMMIPDLEKEASTDNYAIIEVNFNPAIHIHCHPFKGKNRKINEKLLDALDYPLKN